MIFSVKTLIELAEFVTAHHSIITGIQHDDAGPHQVTSLIRATLGASPPRGREQAEVVRQSHVHHHVFGNDSPRMHHHHSRVLRTDLVPLLASQP